MGNIFLSCYNNKKLTFVYMTISIKATNLELTPAIRTYATEKISILNKFLPTIIGARIEVGKISMRRAKGPVWRAEVNLHGPKHMIRAEAVTDDLYSAIDQVQADLKNELKRFKEKRQSTVRRERKSKRGE